MQTRTAREVKEEKERTMLDASRAAVQLFIDHGTSSFTIKELAAHAGISERSFYRYFPRKEDVVRPFLAAGSERIAAEVAGRPSDEPLSTSLVHAWSGSWAATHVGQLRALHGILRESEAFRAQWLQVITDSELLWSRVIAERLGIGPRSYRAALAGAVVAAAIRLSTQAYDDTDGAEDPTTMFATALELVGPSLFAPAEPEA
ncbi:TetR/AcrR family transcriptional regulator [Streptomyces sp. NBC_00554]|uniref:TetR/AcrR family transcriptional regulator n=1 Tax=unclassified Streptomyces TaxID=2593676 RepID=UPI00324A0FEE|nr:TetR/AcrR family transcriptional regulator [Streptomyces sp. NBC_00564]WUC47044.1 TetR/AcrR family transcriptional regulator [Streptomyces sp. NBC_00554]